MAKMKSVLTDGGVQDHKNIRILYCESGLSMKKRNFCQLSRHLLCTKVLDTSTNITIFSHNGGKDFMENIIKALDRFSCLCIKILTIYLFLIFAVFMKIFLTCYSYTCVISNAT